MTGAVVGEGVVAESVVDHTCGRGLAGPGQRAAAAVMVVTQHGDVGFGVQVAVALVVNNEVSPAVMGCESEPIAMVV